MNIAVVANCQGQALGQGLQVQVASGSVVTVPVHLKGTVHFDAPLNRFEALLSHDPFTLILTFNLAAEFDEFSTDSLRARFPRVKTITNIHFSGLHPDCTYLSSRRSRLSSPIGDYHSKIIASSFALGLNKRDCRRLFREDVYETLGFREEFRISATELRKREQSVDIPFAERFLEMCIVRPSLFTVNHPTSFVFRHWLSRISTVLNLPRPAPDLTLMPNLLASNSIFPVYPEIAAMNGCGFSSEMDFFQPQHLGGRRLELDEFIAGSYELYEETNSSLQDAAELSETVRRLKAFL